MYKEIKQTSLLTLRVRLNYFSFTLSYIQRIISKNGMLTEIEKDGKINVIYDNYGNIKSIGSKNITYNKQGLVSSVNDIHFQ